MENLLHASGNYAQINKSSQILHIEYFGTVWCNRSPAAPLQLGNSLKVRIQMNQCQRHNWPNALSTWTQSTPLVQNRSFNKLWNLGQTSAWFCLAKGEKNIEQLWPIHVATLKNPCNNLEKSMYQLRENYGSLYVSILTNICNNLEKSIYNFWEIHITTEKNPCKNFDISKILTKNSTRSMTEWRNGSQGKAMIGLGSDNTCRDAIFTTCW